jgi:hypothetical protein
VCEGCHVLQNKVQYIRISYNSFGWLFETLIWRQAEGKFRLKSIMYLKPVIYIKDWRWSCPFRPHRVRIGKCYTDQGREQKYWIRRAPCSFILLFGLSINEIANDISFSVMHLYRQNRTLSDACLACSPQLIKKANTEALHFASSAHTTKSISKRPWVKV